MIKYSLLCKVCSSEFDSWFGSSKEFDRLKKLKLINCTSCGSLDIKKSLMSPNLANTKNKKNEEEKIKFNKLMKKLKDYTDFVKKNFEYVGDNFSYEARLIHYTNKKRKKGIYGNASLKDVKELKEEGIESEIIPWIENKEN